MFTEKTTQKGLKPWMTGNQIWDVEPYYWEKIFLLLKEFSDEYGHARPIATQNYKGEKIWLG